jgi:hypothetical protein
MTEREYRREGGYAIYPKYVIITIDGQEEVFEQRKPEDILYVSDDPKITSDYRK